MAGRARFSTSISASLLVDFRNELQKERQLSLNEMKMVMWGWQFKCGDEAGIASAFGARQRRKLLERRLGRRNGD